MRLWHHKVPEGMGAEARSLLTILIREIEDIINSPDDPNISTLGRIGKLVQSWVTANNLHPDHVVVTRQEGTSLYAYKIDNP